MAKSYVYFQKKALSDYSDRFFIGRGRVTGRVLFSPQDTPQTFYLVLENKEIVSTKGMQPLSNATFTPNGVMIDGLLTYNIAAISGTLESQKAQSKAEVFLSLGGVNAVAINVWIEIDS